MAESPAGASSYETELWECGPTRKPRPRQRIRTFCADAKAALGSPVTAVSRYGIMPIFSRQQFRTSSSQTCRCRGVADGSAPSEVLLTARPLLRCC